MASLAPCHVVYAHSWIPLTIMKRNSRMASYDQVSPERARSSVSNVPTFRFHAPTREASAAWLASWVRVPALPLFLFGGRPTLSGDGGPSRFLCAIAPRLSVRLDLPIWLHSRSARNVFTVKVASCELVRRKHKRTSMEHAQSLG